MNKRLAILAAAATVAIGASSYAQDNTSNTTAQQQNQSQQQQIDTQNPTGTNTARGQVAPDKKEISGVLGQISAAAVKGQYSDVAERFTKEDRDRLKDLKDDKSAANWDDFKKNWKNKYGKDFDDDKAQAAFNGGTAAIQILSGDLEARTASERMQPGQSSRSGQAAQTGQTGSTTGDNTNTTGSNPNDTTSGTGATGNANSNGVSGGASVGGVGVSGSAGAGGANANVDTTRDRSGNADANATGNAKGNSNDAGSGIAASDQSRRVNKNMATVIIPESHGMPMATLHFINEGTLTDAWRLDVPDTMDGATLQAKLNEHVSMINQQKDQWPTDVNDAYAMVGHHVALAFQDANAMQRSGNQRNDANRSGAGAGATGQ
jgi:hypothetical protein